MLPPEDISPQLKKLSGEVVKRRGKPPVNGREGQTWQAMEA
jgi:hypothetical protein